MLKLKFYTSMRRNWLIGKDPDAGKDGRQEKGMTEEERVGMASPTRWTWVWASSGSWWWPGEPGVLHSMGLQRVRHDWAIKRKYLNINILTLKLYFLWKAPWRSKCLGPVKVVMKALPQLRWTHPWFPLPDFPFLIHIACHSLSSYQAIPDLLSVITVFIFYSFI